jgi:hypothetical protein
MEITRVSEGRFEGAIRRVGDTALIPFSGVLELLRVLEDVVPPCPRSSPE